MTTGSTIALVMFIAYMVVGFFVANYCFKKYLYHGNLKWIAINLLVIGMFSLYIQYVIVAVYHIVKGTNKLLKEQKEAVEYVKFPDLPEEKQEEQAPARRKEFVPDTLDK